MRRLFYLLFISLIISCSTIKSSYVEGDVEDLNLLFDSIQTADKINIIDTAYWDRTFLITNKGIVELKLFYHENKKQHYIMSIMKDDYRYHYKYRKE